MVGSIRVNDPLPMTLACVECKQVVHASVLQLIELLLEEWHLEQTSDKPFPIALETL